MQKNSILGDGKELYDRLGSKFSNKDKLMEFLSDCYDRTNDRVFRRAMSYHSDVVMENLGTDDIDQIDDEVTDDLSEMLGKSFSVRNRSSERMDKISESVNRMRRLGGLI